MKIKFVVNLFSVKFLSGLKVVYRQDCLCD